MFAAALQMVDTYDEARERVREIQTHTPLKGERVAIGELHEAVVAQVVHGDRFQGGERAVEADHGHEGRTDERRVSQPQILQQH